MRADGNEAIEHHTCLWAVARELELAGGKNRYGEPNFRVVWGYDRIVPMTGEWQQWEKLRGTLTDRVTGIQQTKDFNRLVSTVVETRLVPKYLPANCWHLEKWCPPEDYGSPEQWKKLGEEVIQGMTIDSSGPYPYHGEYELCYAITDDMTSHGQPVLLVGTVVEDIVRSIRHGKEKYTFLQRRAAIEQRERMKDEGFVRRCEDIIRNELRPFAGEKFVTVPQEWQK